VSIADAQTRLGERWHRIRTAIGLERPDRTPVVLEYAGFAAHATRTAVADFLRSAASSLDTMMRAFDEVGDADAINYGSFWPYNLAYHFMSKVRVPGVDLPEDGMWQVVETELMTRDDYQSLLEEGWPDFFERFMAERVLDDVPHDRLPPLWGSPDVRGAWAERGVPVLTGGDIAPPFEMLCGARSLIPFFIDLGDIPDTVEAAMRAIEPHLAAATIQGTKSRGYPCVWVGGWRGAPSLQSPAMWNRFVWPYLFRLTLEVIESGLIPILHLDSDWTRELERFRELPRASAIVALDGETDIFRAREVLGDHLCLMGDVPASLLHGGTPDEVHAYCSRLIRELGPAGFILQSGCDIPSSAPVENVRAMVAAAQG
jgi:hypothetical protein